MADVCKFKFSKGISKKTIEKEMSLAIVTAECVFGRAKVRLNAGYVASNNKAVIDASSKVGEYIAEVFTELMTRKFGEDKFTVERIRKKS